MKFIRNIQRHGCRLLLAGITLCLLPIPNAAMAEGQELELKRGFLRSLKFTLGNDEPKPVRGFWGMSFKPEFEDVMSKHPVALEEAKKSFSWNGVALVGATGMLAGSLWLLIDTIGDANDVSQGTLVDDSFNAGPVIVVGAGAVTMLVGSMISNSHLNKGVAIYNEKESASQGSSGESGARIVPTMSTPQLRVALRSHGEVWGTVAPREREVIVSLSLGF